MAVRSFMSPASFAAFLSRVPATMLDHNERALKRAARLVEREAKASIGEYQAAAPPFAAWAPLAASTMEEKTRLGYAPPDNPLLRTGELRDSISHEVDANVHGGEAVIGSPSEVAVFQELGTRTIPPRSFLGSAAVRKADEIVDILGKSAVAALVDDRGGQTDIDMP